MLRFFKILLQYSFSSLDLKGDNQRSIEKGENTVHHCICTEKVTWTQYWNPDTWASKEKLSVGHWAKLVESLCRHWRHWPSSPLPPQFPNSKEKRKKREYWISSFSSIKKWGLRKNLHLQITFIRETVSEFPYYWKIKNRFLSY